MGLGSPGRHGGTARRNGLPSILLTVDLKSSAKLPDALRDVQRCRRVGLSRLFGVHGHRLCPAISLFVIPLAVSAPDLPGSLIAGM
jgi:hypothetical protein